MTLFIQLVPALKSLILVFVGVGETIIVIFVMRQHIDIARCWHPQQGPAPSGHFHLVEDEVALTFILLFGMQRLTLREDGEKYSQIRRILKNKSQVVCWCFNVSRVLVLAIVTLRRLAEDLQA